MVIPRSNAVRYRKHFVSVWVTLAAVTAASQQMPTVTLSNGVHMPAVLYGTGTSTWMNNTSTEVAVLNGLLNGFRGIDCANHYRNQRGVAAGIARARAQGVTGDLFVATKVEDCGNSIDPRSPVLEGQCFNDTLTTFRQNLDQLNTSAVDLTLIHGPPCVANKPWVDGCVGNPAEDLIYPHHCNCSEAEPCRMMQEQWLALESRYKAGQTRAIGVANFCAPCLKCIMKVATVTPHLNQFKFHAGMPGSDPGGLISYTESQGITMMAYQALGHGDTQLFHDPVVTAAATAHNVSTAQVLLRWVWQLGHPLAVSSTNPKYMAEDLELFNWSLTRTEMDALTSLDIAPDDPTGSMCLLE